jgi:DNA-binding XRE family transcriptional regulator
MKESGITQTILAEKVDISRTLVSYILSGRWNLKEHEKNKIAKALKCTVKEIF